MACPVAVIWSWRNGEGSPWATDLPLDQVQTGDCFGDGVLDLQPGVHLEEEPSPATVNSTVPAPTYPISLWLTAAGSSGRADRR